MPRWIKLFALLFGLVLCTLSTGLHAFSLEEVERKVVKDYPEVRHISPSESLGTKAANAPILFDVREPDEFAVSHIPGATQISPDIRKQEFLKRYGHKLVGRKVVFYCSVGVRSSQLAELVQRELTTQGTVSVHNMTGGIFRWHNEQRRLQNEAGKTDFVHPFNVRWGKLINRRAMIRYRPKQ